MIDHLSYWIRDGCGIGIGAPNSDPAVRSWRARDDALLTSLRGSLAQLERDVQTNAATAEAQCVIDWLLDAGANWLSSGVPAARLKDHARRLGRLVPMREVAAALEVKRIIVKADV